MREIIGLGIRLLLITLIAALALAATNSITEGPIRQAELAAANASRIQVLAQADAFESVDWQSQANASDAGDLKEVYLATLKGEAMGYTFELAPNGYKAAIPVTVGILLDGTITKVVIGSISETAGLGTKIKEAPFLDQFAQLPVGQLDSDVDTISGATISSGACVRAVQQAVGVFEALTKGGEQ
ncbi:MAG TPA: FMN-binding protein [Clostridia bacterium]|nr:FMN-binding protein [Clostridia bacterium]